MKLSKKTLTALALSVALAVGAGVVYNIATACDGQGKASAAGTEKNASPQMTRVSDSGGSCTSAQKAGCCPGKGKAMAGGAACSGKGMKGASAWKLPEGTQVQRTDVKGGIDLLFTGKDVPAIQAALESHIKACNGNEKSCGGQCTLKTTGEGVLLSVRGPHAEQCCAGTMTQASLNPSDSEAKEKAEKTVTKKS